MLKKLRSKLTLYRVHSGDERGRIRYILKLETAKEFARRKNAKKSYKNKVKKHDCDALFLRNGEAEILCLNQKLV